MMGLRTDDGGTVVGSRLGASIGVAGVSSGDADGPKLGVPIGTVLGLSGG
jgi:hypothetical protein